MKHLRIAAALVAVPLVLSMAACANQSPQTPAGSESSTPAGPVSITYSHRLPDGEGMTKVADIVKKWNDAHPDIQVTATKFDGNAQQMVTRLETDIKANNGPCLAQLGYNEIPDMYNKGLVEDVSTEAAKYKANYTAAYDLMTVDGKTVGLPQDTGPLV
ncbi:MAG: extracellular solute-binding protein, partial [Propionibacteriaceae bacterium]|nr:extracellular solute-binding protein [Propionibacteriaceae bacterium]